MSSPVFSISARVIGCAIVLLALDGGVADAAMRVVATDVKCKGCIGTTDLASNAVTGAKIAVGAIVLGDLAFDPATQVELDAATANVCTKVESDGAYEPLATRIITIHDTGTDADTGQALMNTITGLESTTGSASATLQYVSVTCDGTGNWLIENSDGASSTTLDHVVLKSAATGVARGFHGQGTLVVKDSTIDLTGAGTTCVDVFDESCAVGASRTTCV